MQGWGEGGPGGEQPWVGSRSPGTHKPRPGERPAREERPGWNQEQGVSVLSTATEEGVMGPGVGLYLCSAGRLPSGSGGSVLGRGGPGHGTGLGPRVGAGVHDTCRCRWTALEMSHSVTK